MYAVGFGLAPLMILLALGGGMGLPLGIPPAAEDPLLAKVAPEECLYYMSWSGTATPDPNSTNHTEQLLAEPEVQHLVAEIQQLITTNLRKVARDDEPELTPLVDEAVRWAKTLLSSPTAVFLSSATMTREGPEVCAGMLVRVDAEGPKLKAALEKHQAAFLREAAGPVQIAGDTWYGIKLGRGVPAITWGVKGKYLIVGVGEDSVEGILKRARTPMPAWLAGIRKQFWPSSG